MVANKSKEEAGSFTSAIRRSLYQQTSTAKHTIKTETIAPHIQRESYRNSACALPHEKPRKRNTKADKTPKTYRSEEAIARLIVAYAAGKEPQKSIVDETLRQLDLPVDALFSTLGRTAARGLECKMAADWALEFFNQLIKNLENGDSRMANSAEWERENWPDHEQGVGLAEAPRGALAHFIVIDKNRVKNYQMVVPTTWNASPRDENGVLSAYESALIGTPIYDPKQPLEILRTIHSFDPCLACAVHLYDEEGKYVHQVDTF